MPKTAEATNLPNDTVSATIEFSPASTDQSRPFIGKWNRLISTTNWEKGGIISQWRNSMVENDADPREFSDEAWSQLAGGVSPQHVSRLRRTFDRFGHVHTEYDGVFWSHFYAALDWDDAEMWLEGAVQNNWSVAALRRQRWETMGILSDDEPQDRDMISSELVEENQSLELNEHRRQNDRDYIEGPVYEGPDFGEEDTAIASKTKPDIAEVENCRDSSLENSSFGVRPFESFTDLPEDVEEATNSFKVAIIRHKSGHWSEISQTDLVGVLDALKLLAQLPAE